MESLIPEWFNPEDLDAAIPEEGLEDMEARALAALARFDGQAAEFRARHPTVTDEGVAAARFKMVTTVQLIRAIRRARAMERPPLHIDHLFEREPGKWRAGVRVGWSTDAGCQWLNVSADTREEAIREAFRRMEIRLRAVSPELPPTPRERALADRQRRLERGEPDTLIFRLSIPELGLVVDVPVPRPLPIPCGPSSEPPPAEQVLGWRILRAAEELGRKRPVREALAAGPEA